MRPLMSSNKSSTLLPLGLILLLGGFAVNTTFMVMGIHGYLRELTRLTTIAGLLLTLIGFIQIIILWIRRMIKKPDNLSLSEKGQEKK